MSYPHGTSLHFISTATSHLSTLLFLTPSTLPHSPSLASQFSNNLSHAHNFFTDLSSETLHSPDHFQLAKVGDELFYTAIEFVRTVERMMGSTETDELELEVFEAVEECDRRMLRVSGAVENLLRSGRRPGNRVVPNGDGDEEGNGEGEEQGEGEDDVMDMEEAYEGGDTTDGEQEEGESEVEAGMESDPDL